MIKLFSGSSNRTLTEAVSDILKIPLSKSEVVRFDNSEVRVRVEEDVKNSLCFVLQSTVNPTDTNVMELMFFCDALKRQEAHKVIGILPYFGYARQDREHRIGECISANVIIRFLESIGFDKIYTFDLHDEATEGVFSIPFKNLTALPSLAAGVKKYLNLKNPSPENISIVTPDQGGLERTRKFGLEFFGNEYFSIDVIEKKRDRNIPASTEALKLYGNVSGKTVIIVDDILTSGGTLLNAVKLCTEAGAKKVLAVIVHHDFSIKAPSRLETSPVEALFTTNTISFRNGQKIKKVKEISVAPIIADELKIFVSAYGYRIR